MYWGALSANRLHQLGTKNLKPQAQRVCASRDIKVGYYLEFS